MKMPTILETPELSGLLSQLNGNPQKHFKESRFLVEYFSRLGIYSLTLYLFVGALFLTIGGLGSFLHALVTIVTIWILSIAIIAVGLYVHPNLQVRNELVIYENGVLWKDPALGVIKWIFLRGENYTIQWKKHDNSCFFANKRNTGTIQIGERFIGDFDGVSQVVQDLHNALNKINEV